LRVVFKRGRRKALRYATTVRTMFPDVVGASRPVRWLDVGAGFGELVEVLQEMLPAGSQVMGIEPMAPKVAEAQARGLPVYQADLAQTGGGSDVISLVNVFSHVPDSLSLALSGASCCARESPKHRCGARPDTRCMASMPTNAGAPAARGALQSRSRA
jgi:2-polyprenyl-3-methyl-5-hydroxy-6-metoxy-1,4-benzoquinol methylase